MNSEPWTEGELNPATAVMELAQARSARNEARQLRSVLEVHEELKAKHMAHIRELEALTETLSVHIVKVEAVESTQAAHIAALETELAVVRALLKAEMDANREATHAAAVALERASWSNANVSYDSAATELAQAYQVKP